MATAERTARVRRVADEILELLDRKGSPVGAGTLMREYRKETKVDLTVAETALLLLLNEGSVTTNRELKLEKCPAEAA